MVANGRFIFREDLPTSPEKRFKVVCGDAVERMERIKSDKVGMVLTSPPYFHQVDYGYNAQLGLEPTVEAYIERLALVAKELLRVCHDRALLWWVIRDSNNWTGSTGGDYQNDDGSYRMMVKGVRLRTWPRHSQLLIPERTRLAFSAVGWNPIADIIWDKSDARRGSKRRLSYSYEHILVFAKSPKHYFNKEAVLQKFSKATLSQLGAKYDGNGDIVFYQRTGQENPSDVKRNIIRGMQKRPGALLRQVWRISSGSQPICKHKGKEYKAIAAFPLVLAEICVCLGSVPRDWVLDPFVGFGTTMVAALKWGRRAYGIDAGKLYTRITDRRVREFIHAKS